MNWREDDLEKEEEWYHHRQRFEELVKNELHDLYAKTTRLEGKMADFETALADLVTQVKAVGERVSADITTLKDELTKAGVATTARFQAAADSIEAQASALANVDPAAPVIPVIPNTPGTPPAVSGTTVATDVTPTPGAGPTTEQSPTATPTPTPPATP